MKGRKEGKKAKDGGGERSLLSKEYQRGGVEEGGKATNDGVRLTGRKAPIAFSAPSSFFSTPLFVDLAPWPRIWFVFPSHGALPLCFFVFFTFIHYRRVKKNLFLHVQ